jgi:hypothetical protein
MSAALSMELCQSIHSSWSLPTVSVAASVLSVPYLMRCFLSLRVLRVSLFSLLEQTDLM